RTPPKLAMLDPKRGAPRYRGALTGSVVAHVLVFFMAMHDFSCADMLGDPASRAGGPGARGGGGGGGGEVVGYFQLPEYIPPEAENTPTRNEQVPEDEIIIPRLDIANIPQSDVALRERRQINLAEVLGTGEGTGGGAGQGTGSGGGIGSGIGTGTGSDVGPGTGGDGGDVFPPSPRFTVLPPTPVPSNSRGRYRIRFLVAVDGSVRQIDLFPTVRDGSYRRRLLDALREYRFTPGTTRDGTPIETIAEIWIEI
ncbi:MAG: hypothetical protein WEC54_09215, partial [Gemmatimonadales bacterium]